VLDEAKDFSSKGLQPLHFFEYSQLYQQYQQSQQSQQFSNIFYSLLYFALISTLWLFYSGLGTSHGAGGYPLLLELGLCLSPLILWVQHPQGTEDPPYLLFGTSSPSPQNPELIASSSLTSPFKITVTTIPHSNPLSRPQLEPTGGHIVPPRTNCNERGPSHPLRPQNSSNGLTQHPDTLQRRDECIIMASITSENTLPIPISRRC
jgi:hypothetical protein